MTRRTILDVPGHVERKLQRGIASAADTLMVDLEDSVPAEDALKRGARATVDAALRGTGRDVLLRVNEVDTPWFDDDVALAVDLGLAGIIVPKMTTLAQLARAQERLDELGAPAGMELCPIVETAAFLLALERADALPPRVSALIIGMVDLTNDLMPLMFLEADGLDGAEARAAAAQLRLRILVVARAWGLAAINAITVAAIKDPELAAREAQGSRRAGFDTVILLHPDQVDAVNEAMRPTVPQLELARQLVSVGDAAAEQNRVSAIVDGRVVLPQHVKSARALLAEAAPA